MRCLFGEVRQLGFLSRDIDRSMAWFVEAWGIGPWFVLRHVQNRMLYRRVEVELDMSIAMANVGDMQFEIVAQHNEVRSMYTDALAHTSGVHIQHLAVWTDDVDALETSAHARGWETPFETCSGPGRSLFVAHPAEPHVWIEISDRDPFKEGVRETIKQIAASWDGKDAVREGLPT